MAGVLARSVSLHLYAFCLYLVMNFSNSSEVNLPGHMKKLGLQRKSEGHVEILHELPTPLEFYDKYVREGKPVVFKGAAKEMPAYKNWNDEYLRWDFQTCLFILCCASLIPMYCGTVIIVIIIHEFIYRNNQSACQACCYH